MKEHLPRTDTDDATSFEKSIAGERYRDPNPNIVKWINDKFKDPDENLVATLMKVFELAGTIKSIKEIDELSKSLETTGLLPPTTTGSEPAVFSDVEDEEISGFLNRREEQLFLGHQQGNDGRNALLEKVKTAVAMRHLYSPEEESELVSFIQEVRRESPEFTPAFRILRVMTGIMQPEDNSNALKTNPPEQTRNLAPDVYFILLKNEREEKAKAAEGTEEAAENVA